MYGDLLLDRLGVKFLGPAPLHLELLHMRATFHWNALGSTLGWWFCHNNTVSCNGTFWVEQVTVPPHKGGEGQGGGGVHGQTHWRQAVRGSVSALWAAWGGRVDGEGPSAWPAVMITLGHDVEVSGATKAAFCPLARCEN